MPLNGSFILGPRSLITTKMVQEAAISMTLANTVVPSYSVGLDEENWFLMFWRKTGPFSKAPATINVAPVSERDLANARMKAAISEGFSIGDVTVRNATKGTAPNVLEARSNSIL